MADADTAWVMYAAEYDTGRQYSRIIPESVRIFRTSSREISSDELQAERERTGLDNRLHTIQIDVPPEVASENLAAYAERYISLEPGFDFWDDVIGDDIVVAGIAYDGDRYTPDGEGGVRRLTEAEQAAREATIQLREAEREAEQAAREAERRRQAIEYATTSAATGRPGAAVPPDHPHAVVLRELEDNPATQGASEARANGAASMTIPADHLELVLAHMRGRQRSQSSPATGLYWMSDDHYRACIDALRAQGHNIAEVVVAGGDRASNETGYIVIEGATDPAHLDTLRNRAAHLRAEFDHDPSAMRQTRSSPSSDHERGVAVRSEATVADAEVTDRPDPADVGM